MSPTLIDLRIEFRIVNIVRKVESVRHLWYCWFQCIWKSWLHSIQTKDSDWNIWKVKDCNSWSHKVWSCDEPWWSWVITTLLYEAAFTEAQTSEHSVLQQLLIKRWCSWYHWLCSWLSKHSLCLLMDEWFILQLGLILEAKQVISCSSWILNLITSHRSAPLPAMSRLWIWCSRVYVVQQRYKHWWSANIRRWDENISWFQWFWLHKGDIVLICYCLI